MSTDTLDIQIGSSKRRRVLWEPQSNNTLLITTSTPKVVSGFPPCPQLSTYQEQWAKRRQGIPVHIDVTALASCDGLLVGCTSGGDVFFWEEEEQEEVAVRHCKVSSLPLKSIQIMDAIRPSSNQHDRLVLVGGKEGMWTVPFKDHKAIHSESKKWDTGTLDVRQILVDRNLVFVLGELGELHVYSLADKKLVQAIDLNGSKATTMALACPDEILVESDHDSQQQQSMIDLPRSLLIGTSDSKLLYWNPTTTGSKVEVIGLCEADVSKAERTSSGCRGTLPFEIMVTAIHCTDDNWWIIAGIGKNKKSPNRNILATLHGSTRTLICQKIVRETIHGIHYHGPSAHLYTIANEGVLSVWDSPYRLELLQRLWSRPPSGRAIVKLGTTNRVAVAGIGPKVDLFENNCRVQSLLVTGNDCSSTSTSPKPSGTSKQQ